MILSVSFYSYYFVRAILSIPFCPMTFCPYTILSIPFCPYNFVRYHFVLEPFHRDQCQPSLETWMISEHFNSCIHSLRSFSLLKLRAHVATTFLNGIY